MSLAAWFFKGRLEAYDRHIEEDQARATTAARMDERTNVVEGHVTAIRRDVSWLGNCMLIMATKLDVKLPDRPS